MFELDRGDHHDHMVDVEDGTVLEFTNAEIEKLQHEIAAKHGFELVEHSLVLCEEKRNNERLGARHFSIS